IYSYYTSRTVNGRYLYAVGGNEKAAKLSGIDTNKVLFKSYVNMAFLSAVAALMCVARFNSSAPTAGMSYELDAIGACFIGGASAYGGTGTVGGAVIGAIFMGVLNNGMSIMGIDANMQKAVKGSEIKDIDVIISDYLYGDIEANQVIKSFIDYMSIAINNILTTFNPHIIIINSAITTYLPNIIEKIKNSMNSRMSKYINIVPTTLQNNSILLGGVYIVSKNFLKIDNLVLSSKYD
ncbi:ROK family protein, partial [Clostridium perfringens]